MRLNSKSRYQPVLAFERPEEEGTSHLTCWTEPGLVERSCSRLGFTRLKLCNGGAAQKRGYAWMATREWVHKRCRELAPAEYDEIVTHEE